MSSITREIRILACLQCLVMFACLLIGTLGICPDACCHDPHHAEVAVSPVADSESHHFCTMLACSHCSSFIAATAESAEILSWARYSPPLRSASPEALFTADLFRPPISFPV
ncbi:hypothetical protein KBA41_10565 [Candidatus Ozemobacteraceae bacterium]|nr:hypothetical protein [Candidatus Ozemobacteraceae bacterium]